jgi:predicted nucleic acid-binding protein
VRDIVYLDICCFKRPFDDAALERVRREAGRVAAILEAVQGGSLRLVRSPAHDFENARNPREDRRLATQLWLDAADTRVVVDATVALRAQQLAALGFGPLDALHLACAEQVAARWFVTTDDPLLRRARALREELRVTVVLPDGVVLPGEGESE